MKGLVFYFAMPCIILFLVILFSLFIRSYFKKNTHKTSSSSFDEEEYREKKIKEIDKRLAAYQEERKIAIDKDLENQEIVGKQKISSKLDEIKNYCEEIVAQEINSKKNSQEKECQQQLLIAQEELYLEKESFLEEERQFKQQLEDLKKVVDCATLSAKREEEKRTEKDFYRLILPASDIEDIQKLKKIEKELSRPDVLDKLIYKVYLEKPCSDLINRVVGSVPLTGIYKITNIVNNMTYVGQSVDLRARWRQHIKRGIGAETPLKNKLYPAMEEYGVWNFTFEVIEQCEKSELNQKEQFWQEYFNSKSYGYSIK